MLIKHLFKCAALAVLVTSCHSSDDEKKDPETIDMPAAHQAVASAEINETAPETPAGASTAFAGFYVGDFDAKTYKEDKSPMLSNRINLSIDSVINDYVYGHSVVAGNSTPFTGKILNHSDGLRIDAKESSTHKYNGIFSFTCYPHLEEIEGTWVANDPSLSVTEREYHLKKKTFRYDASQEIGKEVYGEIYNSYNGSKDQSEFITADAGKFNASSTELKAGDIENMYKRDLEVMRNAIYARHGYSFKNRQVRDFFDHQVDWYIPVYTDVSTQLTALEKKNIELIKRYENHATAYYDSYGR